MFSGVVKISDLDDYLKPAQECIILTNDKGNNNKIVLDSFNEFENWKNSDLIRTNVNKNTAKIDLMDCLACNGCVTTSETILIQEHSLNNFLENIKNHKLNIILISIHSLYSLADKFNLSIENILYFLSKSLKNKFNIDYILEYSIFTEYLLDLIYDEFKNNDNLTLSSECPGWVCYLEKVLGKDYFKYTSKLKSSNVLASIIIKKIFCEIFSLDLKEVNLSLIAPCFDKKLEISREAMDKTDIYCNFVISTNELEEFIENEKLLENNINYEDQILYNVDKIIEYKLNNKIVNIDNIKEFYVNFKEIKIYNNTDKYNNSLSYCYSIINKLIIKENYKLIEIKNIKNDDFKEFILEKNQEKLIFAIVNGFKNIQNLIRKIKIKKCNYKYVEIMACPGGCINGGGQIKNKIYKNNKEQLWNMINLINQNNNIRKNSYDLKSFIKKEDLVYMFEDVKNKEKNPLTIKW